MQLNWKVRFKNKVWLGAFLCLIISFIYSLLAMFDVYPPITQNMVVNIINQMLEFLALIGAIMDPTTAGLGDSNRAMTYVEPWKDVDDGEA